MLFARFCSNSFSTGLRSLTQCGIGLMASRNLHITQRPIAGSLNVAMTSIPVTHTVQKLLQPFNSLLTQVAGFKVKGKLRRRCKDCYIVVRQQRRYVICPTHPRHKQMSMKKQEEKTWILTHATQSKVRPY